MGVFLAERGVAANERVMLFAKNAPEWAMAYFGTLKAGATSVPVGHESTVAELVNVARASDAVGLLIGDDLYEKNEDALRRALARRGSRPSSGRSARRSCCRIWRSRRRGRRAWCAGRARTRWRR